MLHVRTGADRRRRARGMLAAAALLAALGSLAACNAIFGVEAGTPLSGSGGAGGAGGGAGGGGGVGGGAGTCPPVVVAAACEPGTQDDAENCCAVGRSCQGAACSQGACDKVEIGSSEPSEESIGIVAVGDQVIWSTGYGKRLYTVPKQGGTRYELATAQDNGFVTMIATDGERVYFLDYGGATVRSVPVAGGPVQLVSQVTDQQSPAAQAGFARIVARGGFVYWAMETTGGVFRAATDGSDQAEAQHIADAQSFGVAVDDTHVYWSDDTALRRLALRDIGTAATPETVVSGEAHVGPIALDDTRVYWASYDELRSAAKGGENQQVLTLASGQGNPWDILVDDAFVYWTSSQSNTVNRVDKTGAGLTTIAPAEGPWGIAQDCDTVYWAGNGNVTIEKVAK